MKIFLICCTFLFFYRINDCNAGSDSTLNKKNSAGITIGSPGGINLHYGRHISRYTEIYLFGGGWFSGLYGIKTSFQYNVYEKGSIKNSITFNVGSRNHNPGNSNSFYSNVWHSGTIGPVSLYERSWFIGPGYSLKWNWFLLTCDILIGSKSYKIPKIDLSFGYTYSF